MRSLKRAARRRRGTILVLSAILLVVMLVFIALSVDVGYMYSVKARLQNAADAAACAGAIATPDGPAVARAAAIEFAQQNQLYEGEFTVGNDDVELGYWNEETAEFTKVVGIDEEGASVVRVVVSRTQARGNQVPLFFGALWGPDFSDIVATATARYKTSKCGQIIGLNGVTITGDSYTDSYNSNDGPYFPGDAGQQGHVCSNKNIILSVNAAVNGDAHPGPGYLLYDYSTIGVSGNTENLTEELSYPPVDPSNAAANNNNENIPPSDLGVNPINAFGDFMLVGEDHVELPPGTYYFRMMILSGGATVGVSGKTIIYTTSTASFSGGSIVNSTQMPSNLELYVAGTSCVVSGTADFYGSIYAPTASVSRSGDTDYFGAIVAGTIVSSGAGGIHADRGLDFEFLDSGVQRAALVD